MQTLLAFAVAGAPRPEWVRAGLERVEAWYGRLWGIDPALHRVEADGVGLALWEDPQDQGRWPAWASAGDRSVASLHTPLGYTRLIGEVPIGVAPMALAAHLRRRPPDVHRLTPPFVLAELDSAGASLTLHTDGLGLGRLYEVRTAEGWVWSNRPVAALRFAGVRAEADDEAWRRLVACDWAMGDRTAYRGVDVVAAGTQIVACRGQVTRCAQDVLTGLVERRRDALAPATLTAAAGALVDMVSDVTATWSAVPDLSLSGGRDSRLVAAVFLAAGGPVRLKTYAGAAGEAETARRLVDLVPGRVEHQVITPPAQRGRTRRQGAIDRARRWHDIAEGLRPSVYLRSNAPRKLLHHHPPLICGVGGEFGHAPGYPDDIERLERLPLERRLDAFTRALQAKVTLPRGIAPHALEATRQQTRRVLDHAAQRGVTDAKALDWFYADERLRRWGMAGESAGRVMPLLVGEFVTAALGLSTAQSRASALHTALIDRLVPQWRGIGYYSATLHQRQSIVQQRLWEDDDAELIADLVHASDSWGEAFDVAGVQAIWRRARAGRAAPRDELLLQRVVWRATFTDHLAAVNAEPSATVPRRSIPAGRPARSPSLRVRARRRPLLRLITWANDVPLARRLARTRLGRRLRRLLGA